MASIEVPFHIDTSDGLCSFDSSYDTNVDEDIELVNVQKLVKDLKELLYNTVRCDVKFLVGQNKVAVYAVSSILMARSSVFRDVILASVPTETTTITSQSKTKKRNLLCKLARLAKISAKKNEFHMELRNICLPHIEVDIFRNLLEYCYTGSVRVTVANAVDVMNAALIYDLKELSSACFLFARSKINQSNALPFLSTTCKFEDLDLNRNLQEAILNYIGLNGEEILRSPEFQTLSRQAVVLIMFHCNLEASEDTKWEAVFKWSKRFSYGKGDLFFQRTLKIFVRRIQFEEIALSKVESEILPLSILPVEVLKKISYTRGVSRSQTTTAPNKPKRRQISYV